MVFLRFVHLFSMVVWIGTITFFSFFAAPSIFKMLPRETAGDVIGDIFPKYWLVGYVASVLATATLIIVSITDHAFPTVRIALLIVMTFITFYSGLVVGKEAREIKAEIRGTEEVKTKEALRPRFKKVHALSSILNMVVLVLGVVVIFFMAREMKF